MTVRTVTGGVTKTSQTYARRYEQLWRRYASLGPTPDWVGFIDFLEQMRPQLRPATWRQYRAAVSHILKQSDIPNLAELQLKLMKQSTDLDVRKSLPARTSSNKCKTLTISDMDALLKHLGEHKGLWDKLTSRWIVWGLVTGLRPAEWQFVEARPSLGNMLHLVVLNAKFDEVRSHGPTRTVHVYVDASAHDDLIEFIGAMQNGNFAEKYGGCRLALWRATHALWPKRQKKPTLYSARHQFAADAKSSGLSPAEIAALMGHAVTSTHQTHYGKRRSGRGSVLVGPDSADVARVTSRMNEHKLKNSTKKDVLPTFGDSPS